MSTNAKLAVLAVLLFVFSVFSYRQSVTRAERFERGQKFLAQLNPDEIEEIIINQEGETVTLERGDGKFTVSEKHHYPAKNESINRFLKDALEISLEQEVGKGEKLEKELEMVPGEGAAAEYTFKSDTGKVLVHFVVGKASADGRGNYVKRMDSENNTIYLTSRGVYLTTKADNFLDKEILDVAADEIDRIDGPDWTFTEVDGALKLNAIPKGKKAGSNATQATNLLSGLRYEQVFLADESEVSGLKWDTTVNVSLKDQSGYKVDLAKKDDKWFLRIQGHFDLDRIELTGEESEEELQDKSKVLGRADAVTKFNDFHGSWVYQVTEFTANKFTRKKAELIEEEKPKEEG